MHEDKELKEKNSEILENNDALGSKEGLETEHSEEVDDSKHTLNADENIEHQELVPKSEKVDKYHEAKKLVEEAKEIVATSDNELEDCRVLLESDLKEYKAAKTALETESLEKSVALLSELNYTKNVENNEESDIIFEPKEDIEPIIIKDIKSGKLSGFILSLIGGLATLIGLVYVATEKIGMMLDVTKVPSSKTIQTILGWFGTQVGRPDDFMNGGLLVIVIVLAVMIILYMVRVGLKEGSNLHFAEEQMKETQKYITQKANCKIEMDLVYAHINDAISILKDYNVLLQEQNGKLQRIVHFEGVHKTLDVYHHSSKQIMDDTELLVGKITNFIRTSMSEEGKLSEKSTLYLEYARTLMQDYLEKLK